MGRGLGPGSGAVWWCYLCVRCESGCIVDTCTSEVHPVFNPVAPYGYLLFGMHLFMADITNPDFFV